MAIRFNEKAFVRFSGLAYLVIATEFARTESIADRTLKENQKSHHLDTWKEWNDEKYRRTQKQTPALNVIFPKSVRQKSTQPGTENRTNPIKTQNNSRIFQTELQMVCHINSQKWQNHRTRTVDEHYDRQHPSFSGKSFERFDVRIEKFHFVGVQKYLFCWVKTKRIRLTIKIEADFLLQFQSSMFWKKKKLSSLGNFLS